MIDRVNLFLMDALFKYSFFSFAYWLSFGSPLSTKVPVLVMVGHSLGYPWCMAASSSPKGALQQAICTARAFSPQTNTRAASVCWRLLMRKTGTRVRDWCALRQHSQGVSHSLIGGGGGQSPCAGCMMWPCMFVRCWSRPFFLVTASYPHVSRSPWPGPWCCAGWLPQPCLLLELPSSLCAHGKLQKLALQSSQLQIQWVGVWRRWLSPSCPFLCLPGIPAFVPGTSSCLSAGIL